MLIVSYTVGRLSPIILSVIKSSGEKITGRMLEGCWKDAGRMLEGCWWCRSNLKAIPWGTSQIGKSGCFWGGLGGTVSSGDVRIHADRWRESHRLCPGSCIQWVYSGRGNPIQCTSHPASQQSAVNHQQWRMSHPRLWSLGWIGRDMYIDSAKYVSVASGSHGPCEEANRTHSQYTLEHWSCLLAEIPFHKGFN